MSRTLEQKIAEAEARLQRLKAKSRSLDTAQKVIVGAAMLARVRRPEERNCVRSCSSFCERKSQDRRM